MGRGKRLIIVDCITENWADSRSSLDIFHRVENKKGRKSKTKREEKHDFQFIETAVAEERDRENENSNKSKKIKCRKTRPQLQVKEVNDNSSDQHSTKKTKVDNVLKNNGEDENTERDEEGIMHDFDYHDTINAESYEKYFENICKFLKPNSVIIIDNASYHLRNAEDFPVSKWRIAHAVSIIVNRK